jgi:hypothetical protein
MAKRSVFTKCRQLLVDAILAVPVSLIRDGVLAPFVRRLSVGAPVFRTGIEHTAADDRHSL